MQEIIILEKALAQLKSGELTLDKAVVIDFVCIPLEVIRQFLSFFKNNKSVQKLELQGLSSRSGSFQDFIEILSQTQIGDLSLSGIEIGDDGIKALAVVLPQTQIDDLNLSWNEIGDEGVKALALVLSQTKIANLDLAHNGISDEGTRALAEAIMDNCYITEIVGVDFSAEDRVKVEKTYVRNKELANISKVINIYKECKPNLDKWVEVPEKLMEAEKCLSNINKLLSDQQFISYLQILGLDLNNILEFLAWAQNFQEDIKSLDLSSFNIEFNEVENLAKLLSKFPALKNLQLKEDTPLEIVLSLGSNIPQNMLVSGKVMTEESASYTEVLGQLEEDSSSLG